MNALALMATLGLDSSEYEKGLGESKKNANDFARSLKKILGGIAIGAALKKTLDGVVAITKAAVNAYKSYEQLAGGIETLFGNGGKTFDEFVKSASTSLYKMGQRGEDVKKLQEELIKNGYDIGESGADGIYGPKTQAAFDAYAKAGGQMVKDAYANMDKAQELVMKNADEAYMTAGLSANQYMETAMSFSASLLQSLSGDTEKAAEKTDLAIRDMSDNANKMGTDMGMIQSAYAGFAKQNYTMLDNLKLGYGGTKTEMERLLADAEKISGVKYDISSYADIIDAIHVVQENMGITGTTAKEAEHTIEGSLNSTKAAWENLMVAFGTGKDVKKAFANFTKSAKNVLKNVAPVVKNALTGIGEMVQELGPVIIEELPGLIEDLLPGLLTAVGSLLGALARSLPRLLGAVWNGAKTALNSFGAWLEEQSPILGGVFNGILETVDRISEDIESLLNGEKTLGEVISGWFEDAQKKIEEIDWEATGFFIKNKILGAVQWISNNLRGYFDDAVRKIKEIDWKQLGSDIWEFIKNGFTSVGKFLQDLFSDATDDGDWTVVADKIVEAIKAGIKAAGDFISGIILPDDPDEDGIFEYAGKLLRKINDLIIQLIPQILDAGDQIIGAIAESLTNNIPFLEGHVETVKTVLKEIVKAMLAIKIASAAIKLGGGLVEGIGKAKGKLQEMFDIGSKVRKLFGGGGGAAAGGAAAGKTIVGGGKGLISKIGNGLTTLANSPAFAMWSTVLSASYIGSRLNDAIGIDRMFGKYNKVMESYDDIMSQKGGEGLEDMQAVFKQLGELDEDNYKDLPSTVEAIKNALTTKGLGEKLEELLPNNEFIQNLKDTLGEDFSWEKAIGLDSLSGVEWEQFVLDAFSDIGTAIQNGGEEGTTELQNDIDEVAVEGSKKLNHELVLAGKGAATMIATDLRNAINSVLPGGRLDSSFFSSLMSDEDPDYYHQGIWHASAMQNGEILRGMTPFGVDSKGRVHYGGEAGAEAVVGVSSLRQMVFDSAASAIRGLKLQVVLDSGVLVGEIAPAMNEELNDIATWAGGGRA